MTALLALAAATAYGIGDFLGGVGGRRSHAAGVSVVLQAVGLPAALAATAVWHAEPTFFVLAWGALSGLGSGTGNAALYRGLARGEMSVVAPTAAVVTALVPAAVGLSTGDQLSPAAWVGVLLALPAIALVSQPSGGLRISWADVAYGGVAGAGFGWLFVALDRAGTDSGAWPLVAGQVVALVVVVTVSGTELRRRARGHVPWRRVVAWSVPAGALAAAANLCFLAATARSQLTVSSILASLYPAVTVVLAIAVLHERVGRRRAVGLAAASVAVALVVLGD